MVLRCGLRVVYERPSIFRMILSGNDSIICFRNLSILVLPENHDTGKFFCGKVSPVEEEPASKTFREAKSWDDVSFVGLEGVVGLRRHCTRLRLPSWLRWGPSAVVGRRFLLHSYI